MNTPDLKALRDKIDHIDRELLSFLSQRAEVSQKIGELKKAHGITPFQAGRWVEVLESRIQIGESLGLPEELVKDIFLKIHEHSLLLQQEANPIKA